MPYIDEAISMVKANEGYRSKVYKCSEGHDTIGYGFKIADLRLDKDICEQIIYRKFSLILTQIRPHIHYFDRLPEPAKVVLLDMTYQMGMAGLLTFKKFLAFLEAGEYEKASEEMLDSKWAKQTPKRANRNSSIIFSLS